MVLVFVLCHHSSLFMVSLLAFNWKQSSMSVTCRQLLYEYLCATFDVLLQTVLFSFFSDDFGSNKPFLQHTKKSCASVLFFFIFQFIIQEQDHFLSCGLLSCLKHSCYASIRISISLSCSLCIAGDVKLPRSLSAQRCDFSGVKYSYCFVSLVFKCSISLFHLLECSQLFV